MKKNLALFIFFSTLFFECKFPQEKQVEDKKIEEIDKTISESQKQIDDFNKYIYGDSLHFGLSIEDSVAFLGFKLNMSEKEFEAQKKLLAKNSKIHLTKNSGFTFTLIPEENDIFGEYDYYSSIFGIGYSIKLKPEDKILSFLEKRYKNIDNEPIDSIVLKNLQSKVSDTQKKILNIFIEKYGNFYINSSNNYIWYFGGKKIDLQLWDSKFIIEEFEPKENLEVGTVKYLDLKQTKESIKKFLEEQDQEKIKEKKERIKNLNI